MIKIGITLNEVTRDFVGRLKYIYAKYYGVDLTDTVIDDFDLTKFFKFESEQKFNEFLYVDAPMEIFAHAGELEKNLITKLNSFMADIEDYEECEFYILSREGHKARPSTLFFLSKFGFTGSNIKFYTDTLKMWDDVDVLITANPKALDGKPNNKKSVKINSSYNKNSNSDFEFDSILNIVDDEVTFNKIIK